MTGSSLSFVALAKLWVVFAALPVAHGDGLQQPLSNGDQKHLDPSDRTRPFKHDPYSRESKDAELTLYNDPKYPCSPRRNSLTSNIDIPIGTCASANFSMDDNVYLGSPGLCDGRVKSAYISIYESSDCTGEEKHPSWYDRSFTSTVGHCLSKSFWGSKTKEDQWSIMFHCTEDRKVTETTKFINISLPQPAPVEEKPKPPRPTFASVSDSACFIDELGFDGFPRFIFQKPAADKCINVEPLHMLKIYRAALCPDGSEALFAKWQGKGCKGEPESKQEVDESLIATNSPSTCIKMGGKEASSYAFWCSGKLKGGNVDQSLFPSDDSDYIRIHYSNVPGKEGAQVMRSAAQGLKAGDKPYFYPFIGLLAGFYFL